MNRLIVGIDPGSEVSGVAVIEGNVIKAAYNVANAELCAKITHFLLYDNVKVAIEGLAAYSGQLKPQVISTAYFIGELLYRLKNEACVDCVLIPRSTIKSWCFDSFKDVCLPIINKKIERKDRRKANGDFVAGSANYVDDRIVRACMCQLYDIRLTKGRGKKNEHGLHTHSWNALAVASYALTF